MTTPPTDPAHEIDFLGQEPGEVSRAAALVAAFDRGWRHPHPHAWDDILTDDVELVAPLLSGGRGRAGWHDDVARLLVLLPDLHGEVTSWAARDDQLFVQVALHATLAGRPLAVRLVDSAPLVLAVARHPRAWARWWRSGLAPATARRALLHRPRRSR